MKRKNRVEAYVISKTELDNLVTGEYVNDFAKEYYSCVANGDDEGKLLDVFKRMVEPHLEGEESNLVRTLVKNLMVRIIEMNADPTVWFAQKLLATGWLAWDYVQKGNHTIHGFSEVFDELFETKYNKYAGGEEYWPWSFDSFALSYKLLRSGELGDSEFAKYHFTKIFKEYFVDFLAYSSNYSIKFLKRLEYDDFFFAGDALHQAIAQKTITYYEFSDVIESICEYYPELRADMYNSILRSIVTSCVVWEEETSYYLVDILEKMADYSEYQAMTFEVKKYWKNIIARVFHGANGAVLNNVIWLLTEKLGISGWDVEIYLQEEAKEFIMKLYSLEDVDYIPVYTRLLKLLPCKTVYEIVSARSLEKYLYG